MLSEGSKSIAQRIQQQKAMVLAMMIACCCLNPWTMIPVFSYENEYGSLTNCGVLVYRAGSHLLRGNCVLRSVLFEEGVSKLRTVLSAGTDNLSVVVCVHSVSVLDPVPAYDNLRG